MTNKLLVLAFAAVVAGCGGNNNNNNNGGDDMGAAGSGGGGGGGMGGGADMAGVVPCVCPTGYSCDPSGVCVGGNAQQIAINVQTVNVAGTVTLNGAAPTTLPSCNPSPATAKASVHLVDVGRGYSFDLPVPCSAATFTWSGVVFPGTYKVTVTGDSNYSSLPAQSFVAGSNVEIKGDTMNVALDVKTAAVGGTVTLNGAAPTTTAACTSNATAAKATVHLVDATDGYRFDLDVPCSSTTFQWGGVVFPGSYVVSVEGDATYSSVPETPFVANAALAVSGTVDNQVLAVKTSKVSGSITLNGAAPTASCPTSSTYSKAAVHLTDAKQGYRFDVAVPCSQADFSWTANVYPGTYAVTVDGGSGYSNLPQEAFVANAALAVSADVTGQALAVQTVTVGGTVTLNGTAPAQTQYCMSYPSSTQAYVHLTDSQKGYAFDFAIPCSSTTLAWTGTVYPGNYKITVAGQQSYSNLPDSAFVAKDALAVTANTANVALDVKTANVAGTLTLNGQAPTSDPACTSSPTSTKAVVRFADAKHGYSFDLEVPCSSSTFAWSGQIFPGTYTVSVAGSQYSNLPDAPFTANAGLAVSSDVMGQKLDVKTATVGGTLALNGAPPSSTTACNPSPTATKATVNFVDPTSGYSFAVPVACSSASFAWNGVVYPGTYRISVAGASGYSNLPSEGFLVTPRLRVE
jgi:hypothetical protein